MSRGADWQSHPSQAGHRVQFYDQESVLRESVTEFIDHALKSSRTAVVIATPEHWLDFKGRLTARGHAVDEVVEREHVIVLDARETLDGIMRGNATDPASLDHMVTGLFERCASVPERPLHLFGEMVDLLCRDGWGEAAVELEQYWSRLGRQRHFSLFCGYAIESVARVDERQFARLRAEHSEVVFPSDPGTHVRLREISESERRRKEAEGFRLLVASVKDYAIYMLDPRGIVTTWNAGAERIKGCTAKEIVGSHFSRFYSEADILAGKCDFELEVAERDGRFEDEGYRLRQDGTRFWANVVITALRDESGTLVGFAKVTRDLTERRKAEQDRLMLAHAREANRLKDEFLATISHELRTPLSAILGWATVLAERTSDPSLVKGIETIRRNAQAQARIIEDVLDVARIASGKLGIESTPLDLALVVRGAVEEMRPAAAAKGIELELDPPPAAAPTLGDSTRLQQVIWNLLSNALKFTPSGGCVRVSLALDGESARLCVRDTGSGIEADFLPHVFERFRQGDGSSARRAGGRGLGLAIVRHLTELHGGHVAVASDGKDCGATFTLTLPLRVARLGDDRHEPDEGFRPPSVRGRGPEPRLAGISVLVVEDEPDARELVGALLESRGATVVLTASAAEAYVSLEHALPDVIVSDIGMPDEDGYQFVRRVRTFSPERGGTTPIVALTAYASAQDRQRTREAGYSHHLAKPLDADELINVLERLSKGTGQPS